MSVESGKPTTSFVPVESLAVFPAKETVATTRKLFSVREEPFGYTFYAKAKLRHRLVKSDEIGTVLAEHGIGIEACDYLPANRTDIRTDILYSPIRVYYETTLACNLHCETCFNDSGKPRPGELTTEELIKSLYNLRAANVMDIRFTGGELTRRNDWFLMLKIAKELGFAVSCNTNGIYRDSGIPEKFAELDIDQVTISIDGRKESHEKKIGAKIHMDEHSPILRRCTNSELS